MSLVLNKKVSGLTLLNHKIINVKKDYEEKAKYKVAILNLMPNKQETEYEFLNLLGKSDKEIGVYFIRLKDYKSKNTSSEYLKNNYYTIDEIKDKKIDGFIVTGAPVEKMNFEDIDYWDELEKIFDYIDKNIKTALFVCFAAQAALYKFYGIRKKILDKKVFGVFKHNINEGCTLVNGINSGFWAPHSRYSKLEKEDLNKNKEIKVISYSEEVGEHILSDLNNKFYILGHLEYEKDNLKNEYLRDVKKGVAIDIPKNYFKDDNKEDEILFRWKKEAEKVFLNWTEYLK